MSKFLSKKAIVNPRQIHCAILRYADTVTLLSKNKAPSHCIGQHRKGLQNKRTDISSDVKV